MKRSRDAAAVSAVELFLSLAACVALLQSAATDVDVVALREAMRRKYAPSLALATALFEGAPTRQVVRTLARAWPLRLLEEPEGRCFGVRIPSAQIVQDEDEDEETLWIALRDAIPPFPFPKQKPALEFIDESHPPGVLWVFACDTSAKGSKSYMVASLDDFWSYYALLPAATRTFYELIRPTMPCAMHFDLEYSLRREENRQLDRRVMVEEFKRLVEQLWLEETGFVLPSNGWVETDSCGPDIVSYHLVHQLAGFSNNNVHHKQFMEHLAARAPPSLMVMAKKKLGVRVFFADIGIYTLHRLFRLTYSSKWAAKRFFLPTGMTAADPLDRTLWERSLVTCLRPDMVVHPGYSNVAVKQEPEQQQRHEPQPLLDALAKVIEAQFQPESMRERDVKDNGLCSFYMINHDCREICLERHDNQVYAVADLKQRIFYAKCFKSKQGRGVEYRFPAALDDFRFVDGAGELVRNGEGAWSFPAASRSARTILRFLRSIFAGVDYIPLEGTAPVSLDLRSSHYSMILALCPKDNGKLVLTMDLQGAHIRCIGGGGKCSKGGWRLERPARSSKSYGKWNLLFLFPYSFPEEMMRVVASAPDTDARQQQFLDELNFYLAVGLTADYMLGNMIDERLSAVELWATKKQQECLASERDANGLHPLATKVARKAAIMRGILLNPALESVYRECLRVDPQFEYPLELMPKGPRSLLVALWVHMAQTRGYKRVGQEFYVPTTTDDGRIYYRAIPLQQMLTYVCPFSSTPNVCSNMWTARTAGDMERMLHDENHWPCVTPSKRYLGFKNVVYDLVQNVVITWPEAKENPDCVPFNYIAEEFPVDLLEHSKQNCPRIVIEGHNRLHFDGRVDFVETPLFERALRDQEFDDTVLGWYYTFMGRMFHVVGKGANGDNWESMPVCLGAPGTFKSSTISILKSFLQDNQFGVIATRTEHRFPIAPLLGKLMVFMTETGGCDFDKELLKQMASGDPVTGAQKFMTASNLPNWDVPMWLAGNSFFDCRDTDGSLERRSVIFPFTRYLPVGAGDVTLVKRIIANERIALLIKCNTLYLAMKAAIRQPVQQLLPPLIREATRQAIIQGDSLRLFAAVEYMVSAAKDQHDRTRWKGFWKHYLDWCRATGQRPYLADPTTPEIQGMFDKMGVVLYTHRGELWLIYLRCRNEQDPPFRSVFEVKKVKRAGEDDGFVWESDD